MTTQSRENIAKCMVNAYANGKWASVWDHASADIAYDEPSTRRKTRGIKAFLSMLQGWAAAFPDSKIEVRHVRSYDDNFIFDLHWTGTHEGPIDTPGGVIQPTGKKIDLHATLIVGVGEEKVESVTHHFSMEVLEHQIALARDEQIA